MVIASVWQRIQLSSHLSKKMVLSSLVSAAIRQSLWRIWSRIQASCPALKHYVMGMSEEGGKGCMKLSKDAGVHALKLATGWVFNHQMTMSRIPRVPIVVFH